MKSFKYVIKDETGIHARPAGLLSKLAKGTKSECILKIGEKSVNLQKLMQLMGLGIKMGDEVEVTVSGEDEEEACKKLQSFFEENL